MEFAFPYEFTAEDISKEKKLQGMNQVLINSFPGPL